MVFARKTAVFDSKNAVFWILYHSSIIPSINNSTLLYPSASDHWLCAYSACQLRNQKSTICNKTHSLNNYPIPPQLLNKINFPGDFFVE